MFRAIGSLFVVRHLPAVWMGTMRVRPGKQLTLLPSISDDAGTRLPVLDQRARGTRFIELSVRSVLNSPASTHMGFWSINPYVGCEFGCTYCYARDTHKWVVERAERRYGGIRVERSETAEEN